MNLTITPFDPMAAPDSDPAEHHEIARTVRREIFRSFPASPATSTKRPRTPGRRAGARA
jgi:hypothetical protein